MRAALLVGLTALTVQVCGTPVPETASASRTSSPAASSSTGTITGSLNYPSEVLPAEAVYAMAVDGSAYFKVESVTYQTRFTITGVAPGDYFIYAVARSGSVQHLSSTGISYALSERNI